MIGHNLKKLRKERGWTQKELEDRTGIAQRNISSYEAGKARLKWVISLAIRQNRIQEMLAS